MYRKHISYDRKSRDFAMYLNGEVVGYAPTYLQAEAQLNDLVYELLSNQPGPPVDGPPDQPEPEQDAAA